MRNQSRWLFLLLLFVLAVLPNNSQVLAQSNGGAGAPQPPMADKKPKTTNIHGTTLVDDYFWLREKTNPAVMAHLQAEDAYTQTVMKPTEALQEKLYKEMLSHIKQTDTNVPYRQGNYFYYTRTEEGKQYPIFCRKKGTLDAAETSARRDLANGSEVADVPLELANIQLLRGDRAGALQHLAEAYQHGWRFSREARIDPILSRLKDEAAFRDLLARMETDVTAMRKRIDVRDNPKLPPAT